MATNDTENVPPSAAPAAQCWRMQTPDGAIFGPVSLLTLCIWAMDARVTPGCRVSRDSCAWSAAETVSLLGLEWNLVLESGAQYGPLHFMAVHELAHEIPAGVQAWLVHRPSGERWPYAGPLSPATAREFRERLAAQIREVVQMASEDNHAALRAVTKEHERMLAEKKALQKAHDDELRKLRDRFTSGEVERERLTVRLKAQDALRSTAETQLASALAQTQALHTELDLCRRQCQDEIQKLRGTATAREAATQATERTLRAAADQAQHEVSLARAQIIQRETHLADVLREHELRESAWRRKCEAPAPASTSVAAERVIEVEYERHETTSGGQTSSAPAESGEPPRMASRDVLAGLEARLQSELAAWEQMRQTKKRR